ncbi:MULTISPECIES: hypothetical protein [Acinetobacter]|nr:MULTISPECIES: hypothetical protein [Acinetobacter]
MKKFLNMIKRDKKLASIKASSNVNGKPGGSIVEGSFSVWKR